MRKYDAITMFRKVGCGNVYCIFSENDGDFYNLIIKGDMAREAPCGEAWFNSLAAVLTYSLRRSIAEGNAKNAIVRHLLNHRCNMVIPTKDHSGLSCTHSIGLMVLEYLKARTDEIEKEKEVNQQEVQVK